MKINKENTKHIAAWLGLLALFAIPLRLNLTYIFLYLGTLLLLISSPINLVLSVPKEKLIIPFISFLLWSLFISFFGLAPLHSTKSILGLCGLSLSTFLLFSHSLKFFGYEKCLLSLASAQALMGLYSLFESAYPNIFKEAPIGPVTESGQLSLLIPLIVGFILAKKVRDLPSGNFSFFTYKILALINFISFLIFSFYGQILPILIALLRRQLNLPPVMPQWMRLSFKGSHVITPSHGVRVKVRVFVMFCAVGQSVRIRN